jgi:hypothetical protein
VIGLPDNDDAIPWHPSLSLPALSGVHIDELPQEVLSRVGEVLASRERLRALLDAVVAIGADLDLRSTLRRITRAALAVTDDGAGLGPADEPPTTVGQGNGLRNMRCRAEDLEGTFELAARPTGGTATTWRVRY